MIILASKSPRRKELMKLIASSFQVIVKDIDEESSYTLSPMEAVQDISYRKAYEVAKDHQNDTVIGADTIVVIDNQIIGKPKDSNDAIRILKLLSGRTHQVMTGYTIFKCQKHITKLVISEVIFNQLSDELIKDYVATKSPLDKAGAYGVQDNDTYHIIKEVKGSVHNVIGFPVEEIKEDLKK